MIKLQISAMAQALVLFALSVAGFASAAEDADLMITNAHVLTMDSDRSVHENGVIVVQGHNIVAVGGQELLTRYQSDNIIKLAVPEPPQRVQRSRAERYRSVRPSRLRLPEVEAGTRHVLKRFPNRDPSLLKVDIFPLKGQYLPQA